MARAQHRKQAGRTARAALALLALRLFSPLPALALDPAKSVAQYGRDSWTTRQGLPQSTVLAIAQTADGYIWLGTNGGLVRFDGADFTAYEPADTPGFHGSQITALRAAPDGSLWIGTDGKGITRYAGGAFETLGPDRTLTGASGNSIHVDERGVVWIATWWGLLRYADGRTTFLQTAPQERESVFAVAGDGKGGVLAGTSRGVAFVRGDRLSFDDSNLLIRETQCVLAARDGVLWVGSAAGVDRVENGRRRRLTTEDGLLANFVTALLEDRDGGIWIGTEAGINRWSGGRVERFSTADGLPGDAVTTLFEDREGNVWAGIRGVGLVRFRDGRVTTYTRRDGLAADNVTCLRQSADGALWFGTTKGLTRWKGGVFTSLTRREGLENDSITAIGEDPDLGVVVGSYSTRLGLVRGGRVVPLPGLELASSPSVILRDREGALWIGTLGDGLYRRHGGRTEHFPLDEADGRHVVYGAAQDRRGALWFGTSNGLVRYEGGRFSVVEVYHRDGNLGVAFGVHEGTDGSLWVPTRDRGVCRLAEGAAPRCYGRPEGLPSDTVYQILEDDQGRLYLGTPAGIAFASRRDFEDLDSGRVSRLAVRVLGVEDGMATDETQGLRFPVGWKSSDGRLWFTTVGGAVAVDPRRIGDPPQAPPVHIASVAVDGRSFDPSATAAAPPGRGGIEVRYAGLGFRAPESIRFRYRLDGFDPDWIDAGGRRVARYTNIPPGTYTFRVAASQTGGPWSPQGASVAITIAPHFYETRWWYALLAFATAALAWVGYRLRVRTLRRRTVELQQKVSEAVAKVKVLRGLLPICSSCKRIRSDEGYWEQIEGYIRQHTDADFTHGMCPDCIRLYFPEVADSVLDGLGKMDRP